MQGCGGSSVTSVAGGARGGEGQVASGGGKGGGADGARRRKPRVWKAVASSRVGVAAGITAQEALHVTVRARQLYGRAIDKAD